MIFQIFSSIIFYMSNDIHIFANNVAQTERTEPLSMSGQDFFGPAALKITDTFTGHETSLQNR